MTSQSDDQRTQELKQHLDALRTLLENPPADAVEEWLQLVTELHLTFENKIKATLQSHYPGL